MNAWTNWSGLVRATPTALIAPDSEAELANAVRQASGPVRVAGSGHSFTPICETTGTLISLDRMQGLVSVDAARPQATVRAGTKIHALGRPLFDAGFGLKNQGDIDRQAIAGAVSTGTHGTGPTLGSLSSEVAGFRLVTAKGEVLDCSAGSNAEIWEAGRVALFVDALDETERRAELCEHLRRLPATGIRRYKRYMDAWGQDLVQARPRAIAANVEVFSDPENQAKIARYVTTGAFPWETA